MNTTLRKLVIRQRKTEDVAPKTGIDGAMNSKILICTSVLVSNNVKGTYGF